MNNTDMTGGEALQLVKWMQEKVADLEGLVFAETNAKQTALDQVAALEAEKAARQQAVPSGLSEALRQYRHNDGSDGFVFGYDKEMTDRYVAGLVEAAVIARKWLGRSEAILTREVTKMAETIVALATFHGEG